MASSLRLFILALLLSIPYISHAEWRSIYSPEFTGSDWKEAVSKGCNQYDRYVGGTDFDFRPRFSTDRLKVINHTSYTYDFTEFRHDGLCEYQANGSNVWFISPNYKYGAYIYHYNPKSLSSKCDAKPSPYVGHPIHAGTGNKYLVENDYESTHIGIRLSRYYNSDGIMGEYLGGKWTHSYEEKLTLTSDGLIASYNDYSGYVANFQLVNGAWVADEDVRMSLTQDVSGEWTLGGVDETLKFEPQGKLISKTIKGRTTLFSYNVDNLLEQVTGPDRSRITFIYNSNHRISSITTPVGNYQYSYDVNNNLTVVTKPDGTKRQYVYENTSYPWHLTGIIDESGQRYTTYQYDTDGRGILTKLAGNVDSRSFTYNTDGTTTITDSRNKTTTYNFVKQLGVSLVTSVSGAAGCSGCRNASYSYDASNNLTRKIKDGITTNYGNFDTNGNPGFMIEAAGTPDARTTTYTYHSNFRSKITTVTVPSVFSTDNKVTTYSYDDFGNRTSTLISGFTPDGTAVSRTTTFQYNGPLNQLSQIDGPRTDVQDIVTLDYYANDPAQGNNRARLQRMTSPSGIVRDNLQYTATGKLMSETRLNGLQLTYSYYPGNDRLESVTESDGATSHTTYWTYLSTGEVESITQGHGSADATTITLGYDTARRLTSITDGLGNHISYQLDTEGNREKEEIYDNQNVLRKMLTQTFDDYNRLSLFTQANEISNSDYSVDGTLDKVIDGKGIVTKFGYDALKRLATTTQDMGGIDIYTQDALTVYGYDVQDNLTSVKDPVGADTAYEYDDLGNLLSQTSSDTGISTFTHDDAGNVKSRMDAKGQSIAYHYDVLNRLLFVDAPGADDDIAYIYDNCTNGTGRLCSVTVGSVTQNNIVSYTYDAFGNVIQHQNIVYTYDLLDRIETMTYPSGNRVMYHYDVANKIIGVDITISGITTSIVSNAQYAPFGPLIAVDYGNGLHLEQPVDTAYRYLSHTIPGVLDLVNTNYDTNGNLELVADNIKTTSSSYQYDALNRIDTATGDFGNQNFDYNKNANRIAFTDTTGTTSYGYQPASNRMSSINTSSVILDLNGNTTTDNRNTYNYNAYNQLTGVNDEVTYGYNPLGQRNNKQTTGLSTEDYLSLAASAQAEADAFNQQTIVLQEQVNDLLVQISQLEEDANTQAQQAQQLHTDADALQVQIEDLITQKAELTQLAAEYQTTADNYGSLIQDPPGSFWQLLLNIVYGLVADIYQYLADTVTEDVNSIDQKIVSLQTQQSTLTKQANQLEQDVATLLSQTAILGEQVNALQSQIDDLITQANQAQALADEYTALAKNTALAQVSYQYGYDLKGRLVSETGANNSSIEYVYLNSQPVAVIKQGNVYYIHTDHLGTPRAITNSSQVRVWNWDSDPFGTTAANDDPDGDGTAFTFNLRFAGQYYDSETGLHYNYFRDYDPSTGRYVQSDPIGLAGGLNTYGYVYGNPLSYSDYLGLDVTVSINNSAAAGFGHVGIGVNTGNTVGQRPQAGSSGISMGAGINVNGEISRDPAADDTVTIPTTIQEDEQVQQCINRRTQQQQDYNLYSNNCTQFVGQCLGEAGIRTPVTKLPRRLFDAVNQNDRVIKRRIRPFGSVTITP